MKLAFSPDGSRLASFSRETVQLWDTETDPEFRRLTHAGPVEGAVFSRDGKRLATASRKETTRLFEATRTDETITVWDTASGRPTLLLDHQIARAGAFSFSPDGESSGDDRRGWQGKNRGMLVTVERHSVLMKSRDFP